MTEKGYNTIHPGTTIFRCHITHIVLIMIIMFIFSNTTIHDTDVLVYTILIMLKKEYTEDKSYDITL